MKSGERYCLLVDRKAGIPLYYSNLFVTTKIRNDSLSVSAMETALTSMNVALPHRLHAPHKLSALALQNKQLLYELIFRTNSLASRCLSSYTLSRFHLPFIELDRRLYRIQLSEETSCDRPRETVAPPCEPDQTILEAERLEGKLPADARECTLCNGYSLARLDLTRRSAI